MALTLYAKTQDPEQFISVGRYSAGYSCSSFLHTQKFVNDFYIKVEEQYLKLPNKIEDIGSLSICNRCPNQIMCISYISKNTDNWSSFVAVVDEKSLYKNKIE